MTLIWRSRPCPAARPAHTWGAASTLEPRSILLSSPGRLRVNSPLSHRCPASPVARPERCTYSPASVPETSPAASARRPPPSSGPAPGGGGTQTARALIEQEVRPPCLCPTIGWMDGKRACTKRRVLIKGGPQQRSETGALLCKAWRKPFPRKAWSPDSLTESLQCL